MTYQLPHGKVTAHENGGCWVCSVKNASWNNHHIIPRNAGGTNGPQVQICSACHDGLHHAATLRLAPEDYSLKSDAKQKWSNQEARQRSGFLISLVLKTETLAKQSENKTTVLTLKLTGDLDRKLTYLSKRFSLSKTDTLLKILADYLPVTR